MVLFEAKFPDGSVMDECVTVSVDLEMHSLSNEEAITPI